MANNASILLVDDEENLRRTLAMILKREGYQVNTAATVKEAREQLENNTFNLVFLDLKLPDASGLTLLPELRKRFPNMPVLVLTAHDKLDAAIEAVRHGARDYLLKPLDPPVILQRIREALEVQDQARTVNEHYSQLQSMLKGTQRKKNATGRSKKNSG